MITQKQILSAVAVLTFHGSPVCDIQSAEQGSVFRLYYNDPLTEETAARVAMNCNAIDLVLMVWNEPNVYSDHRKHGKFRACFVANATSPLPHTQ